MGSIIPIRFVDPDGMGPTDWYRSEDKLTIQWFEGSGEQQGFEHLFEAGTLISTNVPVGENNVVNLNADGTATDAVTGEGVNISKGGNTAIVARNESNILSEDQKSIMWMNGVGLKINEFMQFINALRFIGEGLPEAAPRPIASTSITSSKSAWPAASGGKTVINGLEYTTHALERMQPVGTIMKGTTSFSRGIPPSVVENAIKFGEVAPGNTAAEVVRTFENVRVVTNPAGTRVISVIKTGN